jgi:hypothetical protein
MIDRAETLTSANLPGAATNIRRATSKDWGAILAMRAAYYKDMGFTPVPLERTLENCVWHVAERAGVVTCCLSWRDYDRARYAFDFFRIPGRAALIDFVRMGRWATVRSDADGVEMVLTVDVKNTSYRKAIEMTGQWEEASVIFRRKRPVVSP